MFGRLCGISEWAERTFVREWRAGHWLREVGWGSRGGQRRAWRPEELGLAECPGVWMPM